MFQQIWDSTGAQHQVVHTLEEAYEVLDVRPEDLRIGCSPNLWPRDLLRGGDEHRALDRRGDALDVGDEWRVQGHI